MCDQNEGNKKYKGDEEVAKLMDDVRIDLEDSITRSFDDIKKIEDGLLPKRSYKHMIDRVKQKLNEEEQ